MLISFSSNAFSADVFSANVSSGISASDGLDQIGSLLAIALLLSSFALMGVLIGRQWIRRRSSDNNRANNSRANNNRANSGEHH